MKKEIKIGLYANGYNDEQLSCLDIPNAAIAGYMHEEYYDYYCFFHCINVNYRLEHEAKGYDIYQSVIKCMEMLGIVFVEVPISSFEDLIHQVKKYLDEDKIFFLSVQSKDLFYINEIKREDARRVILISGYDEEKKKVCIQDYKIIDRKINPEIVGKQVSDPLYRMNITYEMLKDMWNEKEQERKIGYTIEEIVDNKKDLGYVLKTARDYIVNGNDRFVEVLMAEVNLDLLYIPGERRHFVHAYDIFFRFLDRYIFSNPKYNNKISDDLKILFTDLRNDVPKVKSMILGYLHKEQIRKKYDPTSEKTIQLIQMIKDLNKKLGELLNKIILLDDEI